MKSKEISTTGYAYVIVNQDGLYLKRNDSSAIIWTHNIKYARIFSRENFTETKIFTIKRFTEDTPSIRTIKLSLNHEDIGCQNG